MSILSNYIKSQQIVKMICWLFYAYMFAYTKVWKTLKILTHILQTLL